MVRHLTSFEYLISHYGIPKGFKGLDLGCKYGDLVCLLRKRNVNIIGLDINKKAIEDGRRKFNLAEDVLLHGDARNLSQFKADSFDIVVSYSVLEHIPEFEEVFASVFRILRKNGIFYVGIPNRWRFREGHIPLYFAHWLPSGFPRRMYIRMFNKDGKKGDAYISKINYWTPKKIERDLSRYFNQVEFLTIYRFTERDPSLNRKQKFVATLLNIPVLNNLVKAAINKFADIEVVGIK